MIPRLDSKAVLHGIAAAPLSAATIVSDVLGIFNIFVGLMIVVAMVMFFGGLIVWAVLLGTLRRTQGIILMEWAVVILLVLSVLLAIVRFFQGNPAAATFAVSALLVIGVAWAIFSMASPGGAEKKEEKKPK